MLVARVIVGIMGLLAAVYGGLMATNLFTDRLYLVGCLILAVALTIASLSAWFACLGHVPEHRAKIEFTLSAGLIVGTIAFVAGYYGSFILWPSSTLGPLLGFFGTGPAGFVLGCIGGSIWTTLCRQRVVLGNGLPTQR